MRLARAAAARSFNSKEEVMLKQTIATIFLSGLAITAWSCRSDDAGKATRVREERMPATQPMGKHWIQDERLRAVMADVSKRMRDNYPSGLPEDPERPTPPDLSRAFADAAKLADGLAKGAERIPLAIDGKQKISAEDRAGFLEEARTLREHALQLRAAADERRLEGMQRSLLGINATCIGCHGKYKDISGEISFPKSAQTGSLRETWARALLH
jgi:hypothetical protein